MQATHAPMEGARDYSEKLDELGRFNSRRISDLGFSIVLDHFFLE